MSTCCMLEPTCEFLLAMLGSNISLIHKHNGFPSSDSSAVTKRTFGGNPMLRELIFTAWLGCNTQSEIADTKDFRRRRSFLGLLSTFFVNRQDIRIFCVHLSDSVINDGHGSVAFHLLAKIFSEASDWFNRTF